MTPYGPVAVQLPSSSYPLLYPGGMPAVIDPRTGWPVPTLIPGAIPHGDAGISRGSRGNPIVKNGPDSPYTAAASASSVVSDVDTEIPRPGNGSSSDSDAGMSSVSQVCAIAHMSSQP